MSDPDSAALVVLRPAADGGRDELVLLLGPDGSAVGYNGHVDLGTGIGTALAQIVAEELDLDLEQVTIVLGDSALGPDQGPTIASETIQVAAIPLRQAAAQARLWLLSLAAAIFGCDPATLVTGEGVVRAGGGDNRQLTYADLLRDRQDRLRLEPATPLKAVADYQLVGQPVARADIPAKATGQWTYVHDVRLPDMLHGRVVRPPYAGLDSGDFVGTSLLGIDETSIAAIAGVRSVVRINDFIGVIAEREEQAVAAAETLVVQWRPGPRLPDLEDLATTLTHGPSSRRILVERGEVDARLAGSAQRLTQRYVWPYQMHASIGPSCAVADWRDGRLTVWSGTQNPLPLRRDLALLLDLPEAQITLYRLEAAGCYGRNCADDVTADAALLSRAVGQPVRVQLSRQQEHQWEPKGAAQVIDVDGGLTADGGISAYDFATRYPSNAAPTLALLLTGVMPPIPAVLQMGDRTAVPPYRIDHLRVTVHDMAPIVRASWLRGVSALPNSFAHDSYIDELATAAGVDPLDFRLRHLDDPRARSLILAVAARAAWEPRQAPRRQEIRPGVWRGQGLAYAQYLHGPFPGTAAAWSAWIAEVEVDQASGEVSVTRVVVGQDAGLMINPAGVRHQIHGNVIQSVSRSLKEQVSFDRERVTSREWGGYPILSFAELPAVEVVIQEQRDQPPLGVGESTSVPSAAAIANAIFDATGVRLREPPFTAARMRAALSPAAAPPPAPNGLARLGLLAAGALGLLLTLSPWRGAIAPIAPPAASVYSAATIERGGKLAGLGACAVCHTAASGAVNAGGRAIETPFGVVYASNITPDAATGIGAWSYPAFARAMQDGISRDGQHLYPAFPYPHYRILPEADLEALYAYLMAQPAVTATNRPARLAFPVSLRPLLALWNGLFLGGSTLPEAPERGAEWQRGRLLVEGLGHCSGCHSPRNGLGAEKTGRWHLAGGVAAGWEAPPLTSLSHAPLAWSEAELFAYLRSGLAPLHGAAAGPMAEVVASLAPLPDADLRAMAHYLASNIRADAASAEVPLAAALTQAAAVARPQGVDAGARLFQGACAACHEQDLARDPGRVSLALHSSLHSARPDNALLAILQGVSAPAAAGEDMPGFADSLDDRQLAALLAYLRARFAPAQAAWAGLEAGVARIRASEKQRQFLQKN